MPILGAFAAVTRPQPENVTFAVDVNADSHIYRPVGDLTLTGLDVDGINEHHRVHPIEGPVLPLNHRLDDRVRDRR